MDNSRKSITSSSTHIFQEDHENANPSLLPQQHPNPTTTPPSYNVPNPMHNPTFSAPMTHEGARYSFNPDGYIVTNTAEESNDMNQPFTEKSFILEIPSGFDVITSVKKFADRYQLFVNVLCGDGLISEIDFTYPRSQVTPRTISGCYQIISISGTYGFLNAASPGTISDLTVELVDAQGTSVGGLVASTMKVASTVTLVISATNVFS